MNAKLILLIVFLLISSFQLANSRGGRGGGSRGGSSRSGIRTGGSGSRTSVRSGSRSGSSGMIGGSTRYSSWSIRHGLTPNFRYRSSSYTYKSRGISTGLIIISPHYRRSFMVYHESSYNDISICYNEFPLYGRNISTSPWFVCPWSDSSSRYCCGDEISERCCRYFDRPGHLAGLIIGFLILIVILAVTCHYCCKRSKRSHKSSLTMIYVDPNKLNDDKQEDSALRPYQPYPLTNPSGDACPPYNPSMPPTDNPGYPPYPISDTSGEPYPSSYPAPSAPGEVYPPYPVNAQAPIVQSGYPPQQLPSMGYDESGPTYPLIPPENPPPAYSDVVKHQ